MEFLAPAAMPSPVWTGVLPGCSPGLSVAILVCLVAISLAGILISARRAAEPARPVGTATPIPASGTDRLATGPAGGARSRTGRRAVLELVN